MKLVRELKEIGSSPDMASVTLVILGEGRTEGRVLPAFCAKYNGAAKFLWFPEPSRAQKRTGFTALNTIRKHLIQHGGRVKRFLFLIDKEHFIQHQVEEGKEQDKIRQVLESKKELKARIEKISPLSSNKAFVLKGDLESFPFEVYTVIFGTAKNIEEEISRLIELKWGIGVDPDGRKIKEFLKQQGEQYEREGYQALISGAGKNHLEKAFPGLCSALKKIEEDCSCQTSL